MSDLDFEPVPGLPAELPAGESIVWQGRPSWRALARTTFKTRWIAAYFALLVGARAVVAIRAGEGTAGVVHVALAALVALVGLAIVHLLALSYARATVYTITTRRVVMRIGVAIPMTWNLPFKQIASADLAVRKEGDGDVVLQLAPPSKVAWLHLWPHVATWNVARPRPALRAIAEPARVASLLGSAVGAWAAAERVEVRTSAALSSRAEVSPSPAKLGELATEGGR